MEAPARNTRPTIAVASGKGGTGKTTVATNLARAVALQASVQLLDCDVEEPNVHLFLNPTFQREISVTLPLPQVDGVQCDGCGRCVEFCEFNALALVNEQVLVFSELCHSCGGCARVCPRDAITETPRPIGTVRIGFAGAIRVVDGLLDVGEAVAPPIIRRVRDEAVPDKITIIDSAAGTACPMVEAVKDVDVCLLATEPTPFGLHDLKLAVEVVRLLEIPFGVVLNRADVGDDGVERYCAEEDVPIWMRIPMDREIAVAYSRGIPLVDVHPRWIPAFQQLYQRALDAIQGDHR